MARSEFLCEGKAMRNIAKHKLSRRQFAGTLAATALAPILSGQALFGGVPTAFSGPAQEEKTEAKKSPSAGQQGEDWQATALKALREFELPEATEPAFAFRADWGSRRR